MGMRLRLLCFIQTTNKFDLCHPTGYFKRFFIVMRILVQLINRPIFNFFHWNLKLHSFSQNWKSRLHLSSLPETIFTNIIHSKKKCQKTWKFSHSSNFRIVFSFCLYDFSWFFIDSSFTLPHLRSAVAVNNGSW